MSLIKRLKNLWVLSGLEIEGSFKEIKQKIGKQALIIEDDPIEKIIHEQSKTF